MLVFEDGVQLSEHYLVVHNERRQTKVEFGFQGDSDDEGKRKKKVFYTEQEREQYQHLRDLEEEKEISEAVEASLRQQQQQTATEGGKREQLFKKQDFPALTGAPIRKVGQPQNAK